MSSTITAETLIADLDGTLSARIDATGAVRIPGASWVLDWMVRTQDGWHTAADAGTVRRRLIDLTPVVETRLRVTGGEVVHRAFVASDRDGDPAVVVEIRNNSSHAVGVAAVLRPLQAGGLDLVEWSVAADAETAVTIEGGARMVLPAPAAIVSAEGDGAGLLAALEGQTVAPAGDGSVASARASGLLRVAFVRPLPHSLTTRLALSPGTAVSPTATADAEAVARGWTSHTRGGGRVEIPEPVLSDLAVAARSQVMMAVHPVAGPDGGDDAVTDARLAEALVAMGQDRLAAGLGARRLVQLNRKGLVDDGPVPPVVATGATLQILGRIAHRLDRVDVEDWLPEVRAMLVALDRAEDRRTGDALVGERIWTEAGRRGAIAVLTAVGQAEAAALVRARLAPDGPHVQDLLAVVRDRDGENGDPSPWQHLLTARAMVGVGTWPEDELRWLTVAADAAGVLPVGPDHGRLAAEIVVLWHDLGAVLAGEQTIDLLPTVRSSWFGQSMEAHDVTVGTGAVSWAVRWHGARPALLWESKGMDGFRLRCPGLDPNWSTTDGEGEALLAEPNAPEGSGPEGARPTEPGEAFS